VRAVYHKATQSREAVMKGFLCALALLASALVSHSAAAQYPVKPIRLVVGYPPGGSGDFLTRVVADEMSKALGVAVIAENRPGAGGTLASEAVAKSAPDGYTVLNQGHHGLSKALYKTLPYDGDRDFIPVTRIANGPTIVCVNNDAPIRSLRELIADARANPGKLFVASAGYGSAPHIGAVQFQAAADVKLTMVQFKGGGPAAQSLIAGDTQVMFATPPTVVGFIKAGRLRALAVTTPKGSAAVPGIPGTDEAGLPGFESTFWFGLYVPAKTPAAIVQRLHDSAVAGLRKPEIRERIASQGMDALPSASPAAFAAEIRAEAPVWERIVLDSGAGVEERK
jgi:tripartite-type tricarboxylate transporter receptor subunit TctC